MTTIQPAVSMVEQPDAVPATNRKGKGRKPSWLRARALTTCCGLALVLGAPGFARADDADDTDARLGGYADNVKLEKSSVAVTWMLFVVLSVVGVAAMCKNANRSHLD